MDAKPYICVLCGEITWDLVNNFISETHKAYLKDEFNQVVLSISTPGGDVDAAWSLHIALKHLGCQIVTLANGRVYSAGIVVFMAGHSRYAYPESLFLFHPSTFDNIPPDTPAYKIKEELVGQSIDEKLLKNTLKNVLTNASKKDIIRLTHPHKSCFMDSQEAKELGLVTDIVENIGQIKL